MCEYARIKLYDFNNMESEEKRETDNLKYLGEPHDLEFAQGQAHDPGFDAMMTATVYRAQRKFCNEHLPQAANIERKKTIHLYRVAVVTTQQLEHNFSTSFTFEI